MTVALETAAKNLKEASELLKKFSDLEFDTEEGKKKRKRKDPNAPKRPAGSFFLFANDRRAKLKVEHPELDAKEVVKRLGEEWNALSEQSKKPWETKAGEEMERYQKSLEAYKTSQETAISDEEHAPEAAPTKPKKIAKVEAKAKTEKKEDITSDEGEKKAGKEHKKHKKAKKSEEKKEHEKKEHEKKEHEKKEHEKKEHKKDKSSSGEKKSKKDKDKKKSKKAKQDD